MGRLKCCGRAIAKDVRAIYICYTYLLVVCVGAREPAAGDGVLSAYEHIRVDRVDRVDLHKLALWLPVGRANIRLPELLSNRRQPVLKFVGDKYAVGIMHVGFATSADVDDDCQRHNCSDGCGGTSSHNCCTGKGEKEGCEKKVNKGTMIRNSIGIFWRVLRTAGIASEVQCYSLLKPRMHVFTQKMIANTRVEPALSKLNA